MVRPPTGGTAAGRGVRQTKEDTGMNQLFSDISGLERYKLFGGYYL